MTPLTGFSPDLDSTMPGIITDCAMLVPTVPGYRAAPSAVSCGLPALGAECRGAAVARKLDNSKRIFAGTQTKLYQQSGSTWADVSRAGSYSGGAETRWRFAQFGDATLAVNQTEALQASVTGSFTDVAGAPKARLIETVAGFVMLAGSNGSELRRLPRPLVVLGSLRSYGLDAGHIHAVRHRAPDGFPGDIRAIRRLGNDIVAYKERSMYLGRYVGAPLVWTWIQIPGEIGTPSAESVVNIGTAHVFVGFEDTYLFDGSRPVPIGKDVKQWFFRQVNPAYRHRIIGAQDRARSLVMFYYPSVASASGALDACLVYHWPSGKWGRANRNIEAAVEYTSAGLSFDSLGTAYSTWDSLPDIAYDSPFWTAESLVPAVVDASHTLMQLSGAAGAASLTTGDLGDDGRFQTMTRVVPRFLNAPYSAALSNQYRNVLGEALQADGAVALYGGRFDFIRSARWHRFTLATQGDMEITGYDAQAVPAGGF